MKIPFLKSVLTAGLLAFSLAAPAEDIDLFVIPPRDDIDKPNVLIIVDNTANWNTAFEAEMDALQDTIENLPNDAFRIGIMFSAETGNPNNNVAGGYVRAAIRLMTAANKEKYKSLVDSFDRTGDAGNGGQSSLVMAEAYRYLSGGAPYAGNNKAKADYTGNVYGTSKSKAIYALGDNALSSIGATAYNKPSSTCQKNFIIYISNGAPNDNVSVRSESNSMLEAAATALGITGASTVIPLSPNASQANPSDEWARFMKQTALGVTTFTIDVDKVTTGQGPGWTAVLKSMASTSSGKYFDVSTAEGETGDALQEALNNILSEIQSVNSVFSSVSLPVSVNTQGTYLNQVFIGMFRPGVLPRWAGNLKQYKLGYDSSGTLTTLDADGNNAISSGGTGFIAECARSFWTPTTVDTYWAFDEQGACLAVADSKASNTPDGNYVEKGGQAYTLRGSPPSFTNALSRTVYTCSPASCTALTSFNTANADITQALLDPTVGATNRDSLINWGRGVNVDSEGYASYQIRPSIHGDVVHSRPVAIDFGGSTGVVVFYGGNDGMLRAVNGNRTSSIDSVVAGGELWSFMPPEFYPSIKRIRDDETPILFKEMNETNIPPEPKEYGFDGVISAYQGDTHTWVFGTMRRGGRSVYAFNVTTPTSPALKWRVGCPNPDNDTGCSTGFDGMGQSWSAPKSLKAQGYSVSGAGTEKPMLIMGGGYDTCEDGDPHTCTSSNKGNKVYVLDADTGTLLKALDTDRGVVADVFVVINSVTGLAKLAYTADLGGNVYRINMTDADGVGVAPSAWTITKIAELGGSGAAARKFMFAPDVVLESDKYILLLGSGDREKPLNSYTSAHGVANQFFMLIDNPADTEQELITMDLLANIDYEADSPTVATVQEKMGWSLALNTGEQVVTTAITIFGTVSFSTHEPAPVETDPNVCSPGLGTSRAYNISYLNAAPVRTSGSRYGEIAGGGLPPSPVAGQVTLDDGETVPFCIGCDEESALKGTDPPPPVMAVQPKSRVYWHIQQ